MKKILLEIIFWTWCFPQTLLGYIIKRINKLNDTFLIYTNKDATKYITYYVYYKGSVSLGKYIFVHRYYIYDPEILRHERGHQIQSFILGPLYLIIIGLPSLIWNRCFRWYRVKYNKSYYSFYTEKWANKLGGVNERYY